jgi:hypothetical protein
MANAWQKTITYEAIKVLTVSQNDAYKKDKEKLQILSE